MAATFVVYAPALRGGLVWDDDSWTTGISHLLRDFSGLRAMWCQPTALQQYFPLSGTTFWVDYRLWGFWTLPYHVENVLLHGLAACLFWRLLERLQVPGAWLAAAIFALHPVMVESVAWITERKNVLSLPLYLGGLLAYGKFAGFWRGEPSAGEGRMGSRWRSYVLALFLFLAAMLAKTTAFSFPPVLLLLCWWKRGKLSWRRDIVPSLPFFALAVVLGLVTAWVERHHVGSSGPEWAISFAARCLIAGRALWFYAGKLILPANLCFVYPRWEVATDSIWQWFYPLSAASVLAGLWLARERMGRGPVAAAFFFVGAIFPLLGFINGYFMRYSFVCDHWGYLPDLGLIALGAALVTRAGERLRVPSLSLATAVVSLPILGLLTWQQSGMYHDMDTLWRTTLAKNPKATMAHINFGNALLAQGRVNEAVEHFRTALELQPGSVDAHSNLGAALQQLGRNDEAMEHLRKALELRPGAVQAHNNLGNVLLQMGRIPEALAQFQTAVELAPNLEGTRYNFGNALLQAGKAPEAVVQFERALELQPGQAEVHLNLANALLQSGKPERAAEHIHQARALQPASANAHHNLGNTLFQQGLIDEAIAEFRTALQLDPTLAPTHNSLGNALLRKELVTEAIAEFRAALGLRPDLAEAHFNLAGILLQQGKLEEAVTHYEQALRVEPSVAAAHSNLGTALLRLGRLDEAIAHFETALKLEPGLAQAHNNLANALFQRGRPDRAVEEYQAALAVQPSNPQLLNNLAWALATCPEASVRDGAKAVKLAQRADEAAGGGEPVILGTLAAAYAESGKFAEAVITAQRALDLALLRTNAPQADALRARLALYREGKPFRDQDLRAQ
jgi:tetratricopeptide (TPR) repeat protein